MTEDIKNAKLTAEEWKKLQEDEKEAQFVDSLAQSGLTEIAKLPAWKSGDLIALMGNIINTNQNYQGDLQTYRYVNAVAVNAMLEVLSCETKEEIGKLNKRKLEAQAKNTASSMPGVQIIDLNAAGPTALHHIIRKLLGE